MHKLFSLTNLKLFNSKQGGCYTPHVMTDFKADGHAHVTRIYHFYKCMTYVYLVCHLFFITINKFITSFLVISDILLLVHVGKKVLILPKPARCGLSLPLLLLISFLQFTFFFIYSCCHAVFLISYWNTTCCIKSSWWKAALRIAEDILLPSSLPQKEDKLVLLQKARI